MGGPDRVSKPREHEARRTAVTNTTQPAGTPTHPVLQMQGILGNQAVGRMLQRQPAPGGGGGGGQRTILIDANVIGEINRGNRQAANALLRLRGSAKVYISQQAFNELTSQPGKMIAGVGPDLPRTAAANRLLLEDLGIAVAPSGAAPDRIAVHATNIDKMKGNISAEDLAHVAQAKAIGAEVWSLDKTFRKNASMIEKQLGVTVAPESTSIPLAKPAPEDYRVARKLLKLEEVEISVNGTVKPKTPKPPAGGGGLGFSPGGGSPIKPPSGVSADTARAIAREAARQTAAEMKLLKAARFLATAGNIMQGFDALETLNQVRDMANRKLSGGGFLFEPQIREAERLSLEARRLESGYKEFSESLVEGLPPLWQASADPLAAGRAGTQVSDLLERLTDLRRELGERIGSLDKTYRLVRLQREAAHNILESARARGALGAVTFGTFQIALVVAVREDLLQIEGSLNIAVSSFRGMAERLDADIEMLSGWDDWLFRACEEAGYCSTTYTNFPWGNSRIRDYPAEE